MRFASPRSSAKSTDAIKFRSVEGGSRGAAARRLAAQRASGWWLTGGRADARWKPAPAWRAIRRSGGSGWSSSTHVRRFRAASGPWARLVFDEMPRFARSAMLVDGVGAGSQLISTRLHDRAWSAAPRLRCALQVIAGPAPTNQCSTLPKWRCRYLFPPSSGVANAPAKVTSLDASRVKER